MRRDHAGSDVPGTRRSRAGWALVATVVSIACGGAAFAHTRSLSYSLWDLNETGAMVRVRIARIELTRLGLDPVSSPEADRAVAQLLGDLVRLRSGSDICAVVDAPRRTGVADESVAYVWRVACTAQAGPRGVESRLLHDVAPSHLHFARVRTPAGGAVERVLTEAEPLWWIDADGVPANVHTGGTTVAGYVGLGIEHILTGWDHLAFVAGLLLLAYTLRDIAVLVTSFTLAHSLTLALTVLGIIHPTAHVVEALIGFSIALIGIENAWLLAGRDRAVPWIVVAGTLALAFAGSRLPLLGILGLALFTSCHFALLRGSERPERLRAAVAFAFGLIHGFGFAGIMLELNLGQVRLVPALFGFNLGVEIGQLAVVACLWPALMAVRRAPRVAAWLDDLGSAAVAGVGLYWFLTRSFGA